MAEEPHKVGPKIRLVFLLGHHMTEEDARPIGELAEKIRPHVFIPESGGDTEATSRRFLHEVREMSEEYRRASSAARKLLLLPAHGHSKELLRLNFEQGRRFFYLEAHSPEKAEQIEDLDQKYMQKVTEASDLFLGGKPERAIDAYAEYDHLFGQESKIREKEIVKRSLRLRQDLLQEYPELAREKEIVVLAKLGATHTLPYLELKRLGEGGQRPEWLKVERWFPSRPYSLSDVAHARKRLFGREGETDRDKLARQMYAHAVFEMLTQSKQVPHSDERTLLSHIISRDMDYEKFATLSRTIALAINPISAFHGHVIEKIKALGSKSPQDVPQILAREVGFKRGLWKAAA